MAVENPLHLSEDRRMTIHRADGSKVNGRLLHNDPEQSVLCVEIADGIFDQISYGDFDRAQVWLRPGNRGTGTWKGNA